MANYELEMAESGHTRRDLLRRAAIGGGLLVGGGLLAGPLTGTARAHDASGGPSDVDLLNYALTLEHLEATYYVDGLKKFDRDDFDRFARRSGGGGLSGQAGALIYDNFKRIRDHEVTHVQTLEEVIRSLGGTPVPPCTYNFEQTAYGSIDQFIEVAQTLENTGVMAYDGAIATSRPPRS